MGQCDFKFIDIHGQHRTCQFENQKLYGLGAGSSLEYCIYHLPKPVTPENIPEKWSDSGKKEFQKLIDQLIDDANRAEKSELNLAGVHFPHSFCFFQLQIKTFRVNLCHAVFYGNILFSKCNFYQTVDFVEAEFKDSVSFIKCHFDKGLSFWKAIINKSFDFTYITSRAAISFDDAIFSYQANFKECDFCMFSIILSNQHFLDPDSKYVLPKTVFEKCSFGNLAFEGSVGETRFNNRKFGATTIFNRCRFNSAPEFHECVFYQDTRFNYCQFLDTTSDVSESAYRTLRLAMHNSKNRPAEGLFFALEKQSAEYQNINYLNSSSLKLLHIVAESVKGRGVIKTVLKILLRLIMLKWLSSIGGGIKNIGRKARIYKRSLFKRVIVQIMRKKRLYERSRQNADYYMDTFMSLLYRVFSDYGNSMARPIIWLACFTGLIFPICYFPFFFFSDIGLGDPATHSYAAINMWEYSFQQIIKPFEIFSLTIKGRLAGVSLIVALLSLLQSIISLTLIALFLLATSRRFKMA